MEKVVLDGPLEIARGVIGRYPEEDQVYVLDFNYVGLRAIHMIGVRRPLRVQWLMNGIVLKESVLEPWTGFGLFWADEVRESRP